MSEQRTPSQQTPAQPADAAPLSAKTRKRQEGGPTVPDPEDVGREEAVEQRVGVESEEGAGRVQKRIRQRRGKVGRREDPVGVGGDGGGADEGNGQDRDPTGVAAASPTTEEMRAVRAQLAALQDIQAALEAQRDQERQAKEQAQRETLQQSQEVAGQLAAAERQLAAAREAMQQQLQNVKAEAERQLEEARQAMQQQLENVQAAAEHQRDEERQALQQQLENAMAQLRQLGEANQAALNAQRETERQLGEQRQAAQQAQSGAQQREQELRNQLQAQLRATQQQLQNVVAENRELTNQVHAAMLELRDARSPAPNADQRVVHGGGEEDDEVGGGEELPRTSSSRNASYAAAAADGRIPNDIAPLARVIETDPRWGTDRRGDFEDTPNIGSIQQRRYNRSAGNILYEQNFPIGQFASVRVPMPRGTPQTLALFGRNAHVATPAQSINRAIMRYEGRGVYR